MISKLVALSVVIISTSVITEILSKEWAIRVIWWQMKQRKTRVKSLLIRNYVSGEVSVINKHKKVVFEKQI